MIDRIILYGVRIDRLCESELEDQLRGWLRTGGSHAVFTPNPEFLLTARRAPAFANVLNQSSLSLPDGIGLRFAAAALLGQRLEHRLTGVNTLLMLARLCTREDKRLLLLGGEGEIAQQAANRLKRAHPTLDVVSINPGHIPGGYISLSVSDARWEEIRALRPDVMAVALGQGKQERFCLDALHRVPDVRLAIGIGGALDIVSGRRTRAPELWRQSGFEWLWRLFIEPRRATRIFRASIVFPLVVVWDTLKRRCFLRALRAVFYELYLLIIEQKTER